MSEIFNIIGLSFSFAGTFLLTVEAIQLSRVIKAADELKSLIDLLTSSKGFHEPLPLRWPFALACLTFSVFVWFYAPYLIIFTLTPIVFVFVFLLHRFFLMTVNLSKTGYIAIVGLMLVFLGYFFQLIGALFF